MKVRVPGILMNEKLSNISKMFDKVLKDCVTSNIKITLYFDHIRIQAMNERITYTDDIFDVNTDISCDQKFFSFSRCRDSYFVFKNHNQDIEIEIKNDYSIVLNTIEDLFLLLGLRIRLSLISFIL